MKHSFFVRLAIGMSTMVTVEPLVAQIDLRGLKGSGTYTIDGQSSVQHSIVMEASGDGRYFANRFSGRIFGVISPCPDANADICGQWSMGGRKGTFAWSNPDGDGLTFFGNFKFIDLDRTTIGDPSEAYFPPDGTWNVKFVNRQDTPSFPPPAPIPAPAPIYVPSPSPSLAPTQIAEGAYVLINEHSGKCLNLNVDVLNRTGFGNFEKIQQFDCPRGDGGGWTNSYWNIRKDFGDQYRIESQYSQKCVDLDSSRGGQNNGDKVQQYDCFDRGVSANRNWRFIPTGTPNVFFIESAFSGKCLDLSVPNPMSDGFANKQSLQQWQCRARSYQKNQLWRLQPL